MGQSGHRQQKNLSGYDEYGGNRLPEAGFSDTTQEQVDRLLETFRDGLRALVPVADSARIPWREGEAYDNWDSLASKLFEVFVKHPIAEDQKSENMLSLPVYDMQLDSYSEYSWIELGDETNRILVFNRFLLREPTAVEVEAVQVTSDGNIEFRSIVLPWPGLSAKLRRRYPDGSFEIVDRVVFIE